MIAVHGSIVRCNGLTVEAAIRGVALGDRVLAGSRGRAIWASVAAIDGGRALLAPLGDARGFAHGDPVRAGMPPPGRVGLALLGRAIDGLGTPLDGGEPPEGIAPVHPLAGLGSAPGAAPPPVPVPLWTGIPAVDGLLTIPRGARIGIFGPPGAGKSRLLAALAGGVGADAVVVALVGERGEEVRAQIGALDGRTVAICAAAGRSPGERLAAGDLALDQAVYLRSRGLDVLVIFDSLARYADAAARIAIACGEPPGRAGYPAGALARVAALVERAGTAANGSVTLVATVLSDAADPADPLAEAARSFLDGHIVLARRLADRGAFPAIDVAASLSRGAEAAIAPEHALAARRVRAAVARLDETREARELGITAADALLARAVAAEPAIEGFLRQDGGRVPVERTLRILAGLADTL